MTSGAYDGMFDFAVFNGRAVQLVQCWSFQLPNQADLAELTIRYGSGVGADVCGCGSSSKWLSTTAAATSLSFRPLC